MKLTKAKVIWSLLYLLVLGSGIFGLIYSFPEFEPKTIEIIRAISFFVCGILEVLLLVVCGHMTSKKLDNKKSGRGVPPTFYW